MNSRYSKLAPLNSDDSYRYALWMIEFFSPMGNEAARRSLQLPIEVGRLVPLSVFDFLKWCKDVKGVDLFPCMQVIVELICRLENSGVLVLSGQSTGSPALANCYYFMRELSATARLGGLWLGRALGAEFVGNQILKSLALITGLSKSGDQFVGSGVLILPDVIVTCGHVIDDMTLNQSLEINGCEYPIASAISDKKIDFGVIRLGCQAPNLLPDLAFRRARLLEDVVIAGFPPVPRGLRPTPILHQGEICGRSDTFEGYPLELFSSIARLGNSGGPVVAMDGRIVGLVTSSLERKPEEVDAMPTFPFFAAVPSDVIQDSFSTLCPGKEFPWEDYQ